MFGAAFFLLFAGTLALNYYFIEPRKALISLVLPSAKWAFISAVLLCMVKAGLVTLSTLLAIVIVRKAPSDAYLDRVQESITDPVSSRLMASAGALLLIVALIVPEPASPLDVGYAKLADPGLATSDDVARYATEALRTERFANDPQLVHLRNLAEFRSMPPAEKVEEHEIASQLERYSKSHDQRERAWSLLLLAEFWGLRGDLEREGALLAEIAGMQSPPTFVLYYANYELGRVYLPDDPETAIRHCSAALRIADIAPTRLRLGYAYARLRRWDDAYRHYGAGGQILEGQEQTRRDSHDWVQRATNYYVNWANSIREHIEHVRDRSTVQGASYNLNDLSERAHELLGKARDLDDSYLDLYWTGARVAIVANDFSKARTYLTQARDVLSRDLPERYGYGRIGRPYTAWMGVLTDFLSGVGQPPVQNLEEMDASLVEYGVGSFSSSPYQDLASLLMAVADTNYGVAQDFSVLYQMADQAFLPVQR